MPLFHNLTKNILQVNLDREEVVYMQTDMTYSKDCFEAELSNKDNKIPGLVFNISVKPLVRQESLFVATIDKSTPLSSAHIDASKLAGLTNSNPVFHIVSPPKHGKIKRIIRTSRTQDEQSLRDREVWHFTHEDLKNGVIYFVGSNGQLSRNSSDQVGYRLEAPGVQPAEGIFEFIVMPRSDLPIWQPLPNVTPSVLVPVHVATRKDITIATSVVASLLVIIISVIIIIKCRKGKYRSPILRPNGHVCHIPTDLRQRRNSHFDDVYDNRSGIVSLSKDQPGSPPRLVSEMFDGNGSLARHQALPLSPHTANISDSDSWLDSSRSRETSPSSSIPPSLPAFRVIPLCESESSGTHLSDPPHPSNLHGDFNLQLPSDSCSIPSDNVLGGECSVPTSQPLLRRNQYWV